MKKVLLKTIEHAEKVETGRARLDAWKNRLKRKVKLHLAKKQLGREQGSISKRRIELWKKLEKTSLVKNAHPDDKRQIEEVLLSKNCTPRYW